MKVSQVRPYGNYRKLYESFKRYDSLHAAVGTIRELAEIEGIWSTYERLSLEELRLIRAAIEKTEAQLGYIPFCFSTVPLVFLIFSSKLADMPKNIPALIGVMAVLSAFAVFFIHRHFTNKAYNALHAYIVDALLEIKTHEQQNGDESEPDPSPRVSCAAPVSSGG